MDVIILPVEYEKIENLIMYDKIVRNLSNSIVRR